MEIVSRHKRTREEVEGDLDPPASKRFFEGSGSFILDEQESALFSSSLSPPNEVMSSADVLGSVENIGVEGKGDLEETLRSLEEELGVSHSPEDFPVPAQEVVKELPSSSLGSWSEDIWNVQEFSNQEEDALLGGDVGCSDESSPTVSGSVSSGNSSLLGSGEVSITTALGGASNGNERFGTVDIGFLLEASDDELGIPPSPSSEKGLTSEPSEHDHGYQDGAHQDIEFDLLGTAEVVSWGFQAFPQSGGDNMGFDESGIDEWMMGNLDFMTEPPVSYSTISPLVEAGLVL